MTGSPCRTHPCSVWHAWLVWNYRDAVAAQRERVEAAALGYASETADFYRDVEPPLTFRRWLEMNRR